MNKFNWSEEDMNKFIKGMNELSHKFYKNVYRKEKIKRLLNEYTR